MTRHDDETLMRRIDGEMSPEEAARIDADARSDAELAGRLDAMVGLRAAARQAFEIRPDPRDQDLARRIAGSGPAVSPWTSMKQSLADAFAPRRAAIWGGLAVATFVGGVLVGPMLDHPDDRFAVAPGGRILDAEVVRVLDRRLASEGADPDGNAVALTFRDGEGRWCRTFHAGAAEVSGLACRDNEAWSVRVLAPSGLAKGEVRTAAADTPGIILAAIDADLQGDVLDQAAETAARDTGWR